MSTTVVLLCITGYLLVGVITALWFEGEIRETLVDAHRTNELPRPLIEQQGNLILRTIQTLATLGWPLVWALELYIFICIAIQHRKHGHCDSQERHDEHTE